MPGLYGHAPDRGAVYRYEGVPDQWIKVGGPVERLTGGGSVLYAIQPGTGATWRYSGTGETWTEIGTSGPGQVAVGRTVYALTPDRSAVMEYDQVNSESRRLRGLIRKAYAGPPYEGRMRRGFLLA